MKYLLLLFLQLITHVAISQSFTQKLYNYRVDSNVVYASDTNYIGYPENLTMHIYKPLGDNNVKRPVLVYVHGGSWLGGTPNDYYPSQISQEFVQRGYVVANIQYRMGMHTNPNVTPGSNCPITAGDAKCAYVSDTAEVLRALYRAIQDAKSAIRYMKSRSTQDSSCVDAVFVAGESAGAFTALGASILDDNAERFDECSALPDAPTSNTALASCQVLFNHLPNGQPANYKRPDLGDVEGKTNLNGQNARVKGVAAFYGAIFTEGLTKNWIKGPDTPAIYLFHQGNDLVVGCGTARPIMTMNPCIPYVNFGLNDCVGFSNVPLAYGSCDIAAYLQSINYSRYKFEFINNWIGNPALDCLNGAQAGQGHNIDYVSVRCDSVAKMFSPIAMNAVQNCSVLQLLDINAAQLSLFPNPCKDLIHLQMPVKQPIDQVLIKDFLGKVVCSIQQPSNEIRLSQLCGGIYLVEAHCAGRRYVAKVVKQ